MTMTYGFATALAFEKYGFMRTYAKEIQNFLQFLFILLLYMAL